MAMGERLQRDNYTCRCGNPDKESGFKRHLPLLFVRIPLPSTATTAFISLRSRTLRMHLTQVTAAPPAEWSGFHRIRRANHLCRLPLEPLGESPQGVKMEEGQTRRVSTPVSCPSTVYLSPFTAMSTELLVPPQTALPVPGVRCCFGNAAPVGLAIRRLHRDRWAIAHLAGGHRHRQTIYRVQAALVAAAMVSRL